MKQKETSRSVTLVNPEEKDMGRTYEPVKLRGLLIGEGIPKICVPVTGRTKKEILEDAKDAVAAGPDLIEWRGDWYEDVFDKDKTQEVLETLRKMLKEIPLLFTFRTLKEGGVQKSSEQDYKQLNLNVLKTGCVDLIDVENFSEKETVEEVMEAARSCGCKVILSSHDFEKTPEEEEIISRLISMQEKGADIVKLAVMPVCTKDVFTLLNATAKMHEEYSTCPLITMSMSAKGAISRMCGELTGSAVTFGSVKKSSAPGQPEAKDLSKMLQLYHKSFKVSSSTLSGVNTSPSMPRERPVSILSSRSSMKKHSSGFRWKVSNK